MAERKDIDNGSFNAKGDLLVGTANDAFAALTVGANETSPIADTAEASGVKWGMAAVPMGHVTGRYYLLGLGTQDTNMATVKDQLVYIPYPVYSGYTADRMSLGVVGAGGAGSVVRLGIWGDTGGVPAGACLLDAGTINGTSATYQDLTISFAFARGTMYWVGVCWQVGTAGSVRAGYSGADRISHTANNMDPRTSQYIQSGVTGAFGSVGSFSIGSTQAPSVRFRAA